jgi:RNA binding exosome subunit
VFEALSKSLPISYVDISLFAHATENEDKALDAVRHILPQTQVNNIIFKKSSLSGHHGNPITLFESKIKNKDIVKAVVENLALNLKALDKETLLNKIGLHVEKGNLYIRLDKQAAFENEFQVTSADPIRVRLRFKRNKLEDIVEICREIGMLPK